MGVFDTVFRYLNPLNLTQDHESLYFCTKDPPIPLGCTQIAGHLQSGSPPQDKAGQTEKMGHTPYVT